MVRGRGKVLENAADNAGSDRTIGEASHREDAKRLLKNSIPEPLQGANPPALRAAPFFKGGFCGIPPLSKGGQGGFINSF
jgi:hypothetical protein